MPLVSTVVMAGFLALGLVFTIALPAFQVPDEDLHWKTAIQRYERLSNPEWKGCNALTDLTVPFERQRIAFHGNQKVRSGVYESLSDEIAPCRVDALDVGYGTVLTYPQFMLTRWIFGAEAHSARGAYFIFLASRILAGVLIFGLLWRLQHLARVRGGDGTPGVLTLMVIACAPLFVQQAFSLSADVVVNAFIISLVTFMLLPGEVRVVDWALFSLLGLAAAFTKPVIVPLVAAGVIVGNGCQMLAIEDTAAWTQRFDRVLRSRRALAWLLAGVVVSACCIYVGTGFTRGIEDRGEAAPDPRQTVSAPAAQLAAFRDDPGRVLGLLHRKTMEYSGVGILFGTLGWLDTPLNSDVATWYRLILWVAIMLDLALAIRWRIREVNRRWGNHSLGRALGLEAMVLLPCGLVWMIALWLTGMLTVFVLYVTWTAPGADNVSGLQPRYFMPMLMAWLPMLPRLIGGWGGPGDETDAWASSWTGLPGRIMMMGRRFGSILIGAGMAVALSGYLVYLLMLLQRRYA